MKPLVLLTLLALLTLGLCRRAGGCDESPKRRSRVRAQPARGLPEPTGRPDHSTPSLLAAADSSISADDSPSSEAFVSKRAGAEVVRRHKRNYVYDSSVYGAAWNPLEAKREVCELNPDCDELADHIGFQEAYRRFYGPV
ncbi:osteocalcin [Ciconia maguari]